MQTLSVIIPVYNEEKFIAQVIDKVVSADSLRLKKEIIIVDDGSSDDTCNQIRKKMDELKKSHPEMRTVFIRIKVNQGKGAALKDGFRKATGDILMVQDADEEYFTKDYPALVKPFLDDGAQVAYGSRNKKRENFHNRYSYFSYFVGGLALTWFINILYGLRLTDQPTGYKLFSSKLKPLLLRPKENRFSYEVAITALLAKEKVKIVEVPIHYRPRTMAEGKKINFVDFVKSIIVGLKYKN